MPDLFFTLPLSLARPFFTLAVPVAAALASAGCSSGGADPASPDAGPGGACTVYTPPATFNASQPAVTFTGGVLPIFARSCAFPSCHGAAVAPSGGLFLGGDPARVYANLVGTPSIGAPEMARVKAGNAANSYLLHKIDDDACAITGCTELCAESMPQALALLPEADRLTIRAWIAQGAASDVADSGVSAEDGGH